VNEASPGSFFDLSSMDKITRAEKIRSALFLKGLSFSGVDRHFNLPRGTAYTALREPNPTWRGRAVGSLGWSPQAIWPERYDSRGHRLDRQPLRNYERPPTMRQRRKAAGG
jgi:Ner family transcriptional regulator